MRISLLCLLLFSSAPLFAQSVNWEPLSGPVGGEVSDLAFDPNTGKLYALDSRGRPFVSDNNGASWVRVETPSSISSVFNEVQVVGNTVFLVYNYSLQASVDGGPFQERMSETNAYDQAQVMRYMPVSEDMIAIGHAGVFVSSDMGVTWSTRSGTVSGLKDGSNVVVNEVDQIFILRQTTVAPDEWRYRPFYSTDGGNSFNEVSSGLPPDDEVFDINISANRQHVYCVTTTGIFLLSNGTWTNIKNGSITDVTLSSADERSFLLPSADGQGLFFVDNVNHKLHALPAGETDWSLRASSFPSANTLARCGVATAFPAANSATAFFGTQAGVYRTTTGGASVTQVNNGLTAVSPAHIVVNSANDYFLATSYPWPPLYFTDILRSQDQGKNWSRSSMLTKPIRSFFAADYSLFALDGDQVLQRSYDYGASWTPLSHPVDFVWAGSADGSKIFALASGDEATTLYYSNNDGASWAAVPISGLPVSGLSENSTVGVASAELLVVPVIAQGQKFYSVALTYDGDDNLTGAVATEITTSPIAMNNVSRMYAASGRIYFYDPYYGATARVAISADGGVTWDLREMPDSETLLVAENGYLFATRGGSQRNLYVSRDQGATFVQTTVPTTLDLGDVADIEVDRDGYGLLAAKGHYLYRTSTPVVIPDPPVNFQIDAVLSTAVVLRAQLYSPYDHDVIVERSVDDVNFTEVARISAYPYCDDKLWQFTDTRAQPGTTYTYRLRAANETGKSAPTSSVQVITPDACPSPELPANRSWKALNSGTESYPILSDSVEVGIKRLGDGVYFVSDIALGLAGSSRRANLVVSCDETALVTDDTFFANGKGSWDGSVLTIKWFYCFGESETIFLKPSWTDHAPDVPTRPFAFMPEPGRVDVSWESGLYQSGYVVERASAPGGPFEEIATVVYPQTSIQDLGPFDDGSTYYYRIAALNADDVRSSWSDPVAIPVGPPNFILAEEALTEFPVALTLASMWADFDNDGNDDYFTLEGDDAEVNSVLPVIYRNNGDGTFERIPVPVGPEPFLAPSLVDYDGDGFTDILLSGNQTKVLALYKGKGDFTFSRVSDTQLGALANQTREIAMTSWADVNNDGLPDVVITSSEDDTFAVFVQNSDHTFSHAFTGEGVDGEISAPVWGDYDNDGFQDFFIANMDGAGRLFTNNGDGTFTHNTNIAPTHAFSGSWGDYDNDGDLDLFVGTVASNSLYENNGDGTFTLNTSTAIAQPNLTISSAWGDYNNDGYLDLLIGGIAQGRTILYLRDPSVTSSVVFNAISTERINHPALSHYSMAHADFNGDGTLDIGMSSMGMTDIDDGFVPANENLFLNNNAPGNWSKIKLRPANGSEALGARIALTAGGMTQIREISSMTSIFSRHSLTAHFGLGAATGITNIKITWPDGSVQHFPLAPANQLLVIDQDVEGPAIVSRLPANDAVDVAVSSSLTLTFDEVAFPVEGKKISIVKTGDGSVYLALDAADGVKTDNQIVYTLPSELEPETEYRVLIEEAAFRDRWLNPSAAVGPLQWKFTTETLPDTEPPVFDPLEVAQNLEAGFGSYGLDLWVSDNEGVASVVVYARPVSSPDFAPVAAGQNEGDKWFASLSESAHFDEMGTEFYITATDAAGNKSRFPEVGAFTIFLIHPSVTIPSSALGFGGRQQDWKVFSIPYNLTAPANAFNVLFDELEGLDSKIDYRLIRINNTGTDWEEYPAFTALDRGNGYFINIRDVKTIALPARMRAPQHTRDNLFQLSLRKGWNMVGNPYPVAITWADVAAYNDLQGTEAQLKKYQGGSYQNDQSLDPFEGGFVLMESAKTLSIPFGGQASSGGRMGIAVLGTDLTTDAWILPLTVEQQGVRYTLGGVGMAPDAHDGIDNYDDVTPPRFLDYVELNFSHPEHIARRFTREVVPTRGQHTWTFTVESNLGGEATLRWDNLALAGTHKDVFLLNVEDQEVVNMKDVGSYRFANHSSTTFKLFFGDNITIAPETARLGRAYPNPTGGMTTVRFALAETGGPTQSVTLDIVDMTGRQTAIIRQDVLGPGYHEVTFDASALPSGLYLYRLRVAHLKGHDTSVNKLVIH